MFFDISTHAPRAGSDPITATLILIGCYFNPRSPCGERLEGFAKGLLPRVFQPTLPVRGATRREFYWLLHQINFNPRSPCGERLSPSIGESSTRTNFNPRSPCGERRDNSMKWMDTLRFQPTLPVRGATREAERLREGDAISTHAPRAGSDAARKAAEIKYFDFNPRSPCGERRDLV